MLLTYFLNDFEIVPVVPIITGITFVFTFHMNCISIARSLFFRIFSAIIIIIIILLSVQYLGIKELSLSDDFCVTYTTKFQLGDPDSRVIWTNLPPPHIDRMTEGLLYELY